MGRSGDGGEHAELWNTDSWKEEKKKGLGEVGEGGNEWENWSTRGEKNISQMQWKPYDINLDEGFTSTKAQANKTTTNNNKERKSYTCTHTLHTYTYTHYWSSVVDYS